MDEVTSPGGAMRRSRSRRVSREASSTPYADGTGPLSAGTGRGHCVATPSAILGAQLAGLSLPLTRTRSGLTPSVDAAAPIDAAAPTGVVLEAPVTAPPEPTIEKPRRRTKSSQAPQRKAAREAAREGRSALPAPAPQLLHGLSMYVPKQRQADSWDCGLACVQMVLLSLGCSPDECSLARLRGRLVSSEVWSIDLAYLLTEFGATCEYVTAVRGEAPSPGRRNCPFYASSLKEDGARVAALLAHAAKEHVGVRHAKLSPAELWNLLADEEHVVIVLVEHRALYPPGPQGSLSPCGSPEASGPSAFSGHYVLLTGLDHTSESYVVKDPARPEEVLLVPARQLERARRAYGTDEDLVLVPLEQEREPAAPLATEALKIQAVLEAHANR